MQQLNDSDLNDPPREAGTPHGPIEVRGWASDNYVLIGRPAVIVNPQADVLSLLSWGLGHLEQLKVLLDSREGESGQRSDVAVCHFLEQAETVIRAGVEKLFELEISASDRSPIQR